MVIFVLIISQIIRDLHITLFVLALVVVDVVILMTYTIVEGVKGNLEPMRVVNAENPHDIIGVSFCFVSIYRGYVITSFLWGKIESKRKYIWNSRHLQWQECTVGSGGK